MSIEKLASGRWRVRWYTSDGRHPSRTFTLRKDAERWERDAIRAAENRTDTTTTNPRAAPQTLRHVIQAWWPGKERSIKPRTAERYIEHLRKLEQHPIATLPVAELRFRDVQGFVDDMAATYAPKTVRGIHGVLHLVLVHAGKHELLERELPRPELPKPIRKTIVVPTKAEVEQLAAAADARLYAAHLLAGYCGPRQGELLALRREDVNLAEGWVFVHQARNKTTGAFESTKTDKARRVYLPNRVVTVLGEHLGEYDGSMLFPVTASVFDKSWRHARRACGLERVRFHDLRHAAASMMIAAGWNVLQVSKQLGHANATMTLNIYGHLFPEDLGTAIRKMDEYLDH